MGRSRVISASSDWTSSYGESTGATDHESEMGTAGPEEEWLRRMLEGVQMPSEILDGDHESVLNDLDALEHGLKVIGFAKITDAVESSARAKVAFEQMLRTQSKKKEHYRTRMLVLEQYKDLVHKLSTENRHLREQLSAFRDAENPSAPNNMGGNDGFRGDVNEAKAEAVNQLCHASKAVNDSRAVQAEGIGE